MEITLTQILALVGKLDDTSGANAPRERFRSFLKENVKEIGQVRDYVQECLRSRGDQYDRALQDLVNYLGRFLEFEVDYGRYQGVQGQNNFDGHWVSPKNFHVVVEAKTTEVYAINTAKLVGYVDELISARSIPGWDKALGLYVVGRPDPEVHHLEAAIIGERRTAQLRVISAESLLSLAELMTEYDVSHDDILEVLCPSGQRVDTVIDLMTRLVAQRALEPAVGPNVAGGAAPEAPVQGQGIAEAIYWLTPVKSDDVQTAEDTVRTLVGKEHIYAFGERTPGRKRLKIGDWICFYATAKGVIAHARVTSAPEKKKHPRVRHADKYTWVCCLDNTELYLDSPVVVDASLRGRLDAFQGRDLEKSWAWFVQATRSVSARDFGLLTRKEPVK